MLVLFIIIAIFHLIRILRDFADASESVRETAQKMNESVVRITDKVNETADQISEFVIKPFTVIQFLMEKMRPVIEMMQKKGEEWAGEYGEEEEEETKPKKKRKFGRKK